MSDILFPLAGVGLLTLLGLDVFFTVLHPQAHGGPLNRFLARGIWKVFRGLGRCGRSTRDKLLSFGGPVITASVILVWPLLLVVGFALILVPMILDFHYSSGTPGAAWLEALYFSGYIASTLGLGDVIPPGTAGRVLTVVESLAGFALVSLSAAYILSVYRERAAAIALAMTISGTLPTYRSVRNDGDVRGVDEVQFATWLTSTAAMLNHITHAYTQYPILFVFRHADRTASLPAQVGELYEWIQAVRSDTETTPGWIEPLARSINEYLGSVTRHFVPAAGEDLGERDRLDRMLEYFCYTKERASRA